MCGILGSFGSLPEEKKRENFINLLSYRGPNFKSNWINNSEKIWMGHTRLSILDLSENGNQPMHFKNDFCDFTIIFNGEIYNYLKLKKDLIEAGEDFFSTTDTEVILKSYKIWGIEFVKKIHGMFSIAIWDNKIKKGFLIRDHIGQKPLYWFKENKNVFFCSSLLILSKIIKNKNLDTRSLSHFLSTGFVHFPNTIFKNIYSLEPGTILEWKQNGDITKKNYWSILNIKKTEAKLNIEEFDELFSNVIKEHLNSDVKIALLLSGGLDSSLIASYIDNPNVIYTFLNETKSRNQELNFKNIFLSKVNKMSIDYDSGNIDPLSLLKETVPFTQQPTGHNSFMSFFLLNKFLKKDNIKVSISGDGADELFFGYKWYYKNKLSDRFKKYIQAYIFQNSYKKDCIQSDLFNFMFNSFFAFSPKDINNFTNDKDYSIEYMVDPLKRSFNNNTNYNDKFRNMDLMNFCTDSILKKTDEMSMANSIENRAPFLDNRIIEYVLSKKADFSDFKNSKKFLKDLFYKKIKLKFPNFKHGFSFKGLGNNFYNDLLIEIKNSKLVKDGIISKNYINFINGNNYHVRNKIFILSNLAIWYNLNFS